MKRIVISCFLIMALCAGGIALAQTGYLQPRVTAAYSSIIAALGFTPAHSGANSDITSLSGLSTLSLTPSLGSELSPAYTGASGVNWTLGTGWQTPISGGVLNANASGTGTATPTVPIVVTPGDIYQITVTPNVSADIAYYTIGGNAGTPLNGSTPYVDYIFCDSSDSLVITKTSAFRGTATFSVKKLLNASTFYGTATLYGPLKIMGPIEELTGGIQLGFGTGRNAQDNSVAIGYQALHSMRGTLSGGGATGIGLQAGYSTTTGTTCAVGCQAAYWNTTGTAVAFGSEAAANNTTGAITAIGHQAGNSNIDGIGVTAVGQTAGYGMQHNDLTAIGWQAAYNTTASGSTAVGMNAAQTNTTGVVTAVGQEAAYSQQSGEITAVGAHAGHESTTGNKTVVGHYVASNNTTGTVTAVGDNAGHANVTGSGVFLGDHAGAYDVGTGNVFYVDNLNRSNTAGDQAGAIFYGTFDATPTNQTLHINAKTSVFNASVVRTIFQTAVPFVIPSSGSIGNNGALSGITALPATITQGYFYFPLHAISSTSAAGLYWVVMTNTTTGTIYNNTYTSGQPVVPASPTAFVTTGPGSYTQTTGSAINLVQAVVPGNSIGPDGSFSFLPACSVNANSNSKYQFMTFGGQQIVNYGLSTLGYGETPRNLINRGATNIQVAENQLYYGYGYQNQLPVAFAIDTTANQTAVCQLQIQTATDWAVLEFFRIDARN